MWRIEMLGGLRACREQVVITRFRSRNAALLLAWLAAHPNQSHPRERLLELLWSDLDLATARQRFRPDLTSLRQLLEPENTPSGSVLSADRESVRLRPEAITTDVALFETALTEATQTTSDRLRAEKLQAAIGFYTGEFLPAYYEDWVLQERDRLATRYREAVMLLATTWSASGETEAALEWAHQALACDTLQEEAHILLMRLYARLGKPAAVLRQYQEMERVFWEALEEKPPTSLQALAEQLREEARSQLAQTSPKPPTATPPPPLLRLPRPLTRFFGRDSEIAGLLELLKGEETPLVTLMGVGGSGKTRLSLEVARRLAKETGKQVAFVALADLQDASLIPAAILEALGVPKTLHTEPESQLIDLLIDRPTLLVLDNFEQLASEGALIAQNLLKRLPELTLLVTSRVRLRLSGERLFPVSPLPVPSERFDSPESLLSYASVALFVDRVQAIRPAFALTQENAETIAQLCARLEGIPLALELAAAQMAIRALRELASDLDSHLSQLARPERDAEPRHQTLWAAVEWSYRLLSPALQSLFCRLSVFRGGWTRDAAEAVCLEPLAWEGLAQLEASSLILAEEGRSGMRFRMLEVLRQYGAERLEQSGEGEETRRRHRDWYLALAETSGAQWQGAAQERWLARFEEEHDNFRVALTTCLTESDGAEIGLRMTAALRAFWMVHGHLSEGRAHLLAALSRKEAHSSPYRLNALSALALLTYYQGDYDQARTLNEECLTAQRAQANTSEIASALTALGLIAQRQGDYPRAVTLLEECVTTWRALEQKDSLASALFNLAMTLHYQEENARAQTLVEEALALSREIGHRVWEAVSLEILGVALYAQGEIALARARYEESLALRRSLGDKMGVAITLQRLGVLASDANDTIQARALYGESLALSRELGEKRTLTYALEGCADVFAREGEILRALQLWGAAEALRERIGAPLAPSERARRDAQIAQTREKTGDEAYAHAWTEGRALSWERAVRLAQT